MDHVNEFNPLAAPVRQDYTFEGWALVPEGEPVYTTETVVTAEVGTKLYAIWAVIDYSADDAGENVGGETGENNGGNAEQTPGQNPEEDPQTVNS